MPVAHQFTGRTVVVEGKERLYFSGTSYLGINSDSNFREILQEGLSRYGTNYGSSRASNLQLAIFEEAEQQLAAYTGAEAALTFSSGYLAGQAVVHTLNEGRSFVYAPETHPALWRHRQDGWYGRQEDWVASLPEVVSARQQEVVIVTNSLNPLTAEKYAFDWVDQLPADKSIILLVDDSHGFGVTGEEGAGIYPVLKKKLRPGIQLLLVSSLGKACGIPGGLVLGTKASLQLLKNSPFFTAGSPIPPAYLYAYLQAQPVYRAARKKLLSNVRYFQEQMRSHSLFRYFDHYPVFSTSYHDLASYVEEQCILSSFPYPHPDSEPVTRVVINSLHLQEDIDILSACIAAYPGRAC